MAAKIVAEATHRGLLEVADDLLRLSQLEVPFDTGHLMQTGNRRTITPDEQEVGYFTPYAARLHEHPEYHFQNGRKGKYLEDPLKQNAKLFGSWIQQTINRAL
jgi:hypothetical protein